MNNIEQLKIEVDEIKKSLNELKNNVSFSEIEKTRLKTLKSQAEITKEKIQAEIKTLTNKTDKNCKKEKEEAEALLNSVNEALRLYSSVLN